MQVSSVKYKELNEELRIDAEYYRQEIIEKIKTLDQKNTKLLDEIVNFIVGPFGSTEP